MVESAKDGSMEKLFSGDKEFIQWIIPACLLAVDCSCFSGISTVETPRGKIPIGDLRLGDNVLREGCRKKT